MSEDSEVDKNKKLTASEVCLPVHQDDGILGENEPPPSIREALLRRNTGPLTGIIYCSEPPKEGGSQNSGDDKAQPTKKKKFFYDGGRLHELNPDDEFDEYKLSMSTRYDSSPDPNDGDICAHINAQPCKREIINHIIGVDTAYADAIALRTGNFYNEPAKETSDDVSTKAKEDGGSDTVASEISEASTNRQTKKRTKEEIEHEKQKLSGEEWFKKNWKNPGEDIKPKASGENSGSGITGPSVSDNSASQDQKRTPEEDTMPEGSDKNSGSGTTSPSVSDNSTNKSRGKRPEDDVRQMGSDKDSGSGTTSPSVTDNSTSESQEKRSGEDTRPKGNDKDSGSGTTSPSVSDNSTNKSRGKRPEDDARQMGNDKESGSGTTSPSVSDNSTSRGQRKRSRKDTGPKRSDGDSGSETASPSGSDTSTRKSRGKRSKKDTKPERSEGESGSGTTSPSGSDTSTSKSKGKSPNPSAHQDNRDSTLPSPCQAEYSGNTAIPDSTVEGAKVRQRDICHCRRVPQLHMAHRNYNGELYCQALDSMNDKIIGCSNTVPSDDAPMFRASEKTSYQVLCYTHRQRLIRHNSCPVCGLYCTKGRFFMCKSKHHFHKACAPKNDKGLVICPHCGDDTPPKSVVMFIKTPKQPVLLPQQKPPKTVKSARIRITRGIPQILDDNRDPEFDLPPALRAILESGRNSGGVDVSDGNMLAHLLSIACRSLPELPSNCNTRRCSYKAMYAALEAGDAVKVLKMITAGLNPNHQFEDQNQMNPLHIAAKNGHATLVHVLLQSQADINAVDAEQNTPLTLAITARHNEIVKYLVRSGADVFIKGEDGMTPLHVAAKFGNVEACFHLLSAPNVPYSYMDSLDDGGWTPLVWASEFNHMEVVRFLLHKGADSLVKDTEQNIALHWAAFGGSIDIVELFLNDGVDINVVNAHGDTPLHIAARQDKYNCVLLLLARGAKSSIRNLAGEYARDCSESPESDIYKAITLNMEIQKILGRFPAIRGTRILSNDITRGKERNQIQCVNSLDGEQWPSDFVYVTQCCFTSRIQVDRIITEMKYCECSDVCNTLTCGCGNILIRYDANGRLQHDFTSNDPPMILECNEVCHCNRILCKNRVVQNGLTCRFQLFKTEKKGWGIKTILPILKGTFVCEYIGEIITDSEADQREDDSYLFDLDNKDGESYCIDARYYGNFARFINHMCAPNLSPVHVFTDHQDIRFPRIAFFANRDIAAGEELGYNYGEKFWTIKCKSFTCNCGSDKCIYSEAAINETLENYNRKNEEEGAAASQP